MSDLGYLVGDRLDDGRVRVAERAHRDAGDQVQVLVAVGVPDPASLAAGERQRRGAVVGHHRRLEPLAQRVALGHVSSPITMVPMPESVNISSRTACCRRPSRTWARGTPPRTAVRQASIFGIMPADRLGSNRSSSIAPSWLMTSEEAGQSR